MNEFDVVSIKKYFSNKALLIFAKMNIVTIGDLFNLDDNGRLGLVIDTLYDTQEYTLAEEIKNNVNILKCEYKEIDPKIDVDNMTMFDLGVTEEQREYLEDHQISIDRLKELYFTYDLEAYDELRDVKLLLPLIRKIGIIVKYYSNKNVVEFNTKARQEALQKEIIELETQKTLIEQKIIEKRRKLTEISRKRM